MCACARACVPRIVWTADADPGKKGRGKSPHWASKTGLWCVHVTKANKKVRPVCGKGQEGSEVCVRGREREDKGVAKGQ